METADVLILDDNNLLIRSSLTEFISSSNYLSVVGACSDGYGLLSCIQNNKIDMILIDALMKRNDGIDAVKLVKEYYPNIRVVGFSIIESKYYAKEMEASGADGFISILDMTDDQILNELGKIVFR